MKYLCIDVGSSYIKTALINTVRRTVLVFPPDRTAPPLYDKSGLRYEINADVLFEQFKQNIDRVLGFSENDIAGILISTQMHGFVFTGAKGIPYTPYISWQDTRSLTPYPDMSGDTYLERLKKEIPPKLMSCSGVALKPGLGMCNACVLLREKHFAVPPDARLCTLGAYLTLRLSGGFGCHLTNAAPIGLADITKCRWNSELIHLLGFETFLFPPIVPETSPLGKYRGINIYPDFGDQQCGVLGGLVRSDADINVNIGTAGQISRIVSSFSRGEFERRPFFKNKYLLTVSRLPSGRNLAVVMRFFRDVAHQITGVGISDREVWNAMERCVSEKADLSRLKVSCGFFPDSIGDTQGSVCGIDEHNFTFANMTYALYQKIGEIYRKYINILGKTSPAPKRLVFTGGVAVKDPILFSAISKGSGLEYCLSSYKNEVFVGLFQIALLLENPNLSLEQIREQTEKKPLVLSFK